MIARSFDASTELGNAFQLLVSRWTVVLPTAIGSLVAGILLIVTLGTIVASIFGGGAALAGGHRAGALAVLGAGAVTKVIE